jgi:hypothetical protein
LPDLRDEEVWDIEERRQNWLIEIARYAEALGITIEEAKQRAAAQHRQRMK